MKLEGVTVLDLSSFLPGPYLSLAMADHGAEVIKIEPPGGDPGRQIGPRDGPETVFFKNLNRGKKSIVLDLKKGGDHEIFLRLADTADVIIESWRPGVAARLGVDYGTLAGRNPRIVYCSISAFGQEGPLASRPAHDLALQAITGVLSTSIGNDGKPALPAVPAADCLSGLQGLAGVLMALYRREWTGRGDYIDISMQQSMLAAALNVLGSAMAEGRQQNPIDERTTGGAAFYRLYDTADARQIALAGQEPKFVHALLGAIGRIDLAPLCVEPGPHQQPVVEALQRVFGRLSLAEIQDWLTGLDICWAPVNTFPEALEDEQLLASHFVLTDLEDRRHIAPVIRFREEPAQPRLVAPQLNQHGHGCHATDKQQG